MEIVYAFITFDEIEDALQAVRWATARNRDFSLKPECPGFRFRIQVLPADGKTVEDIKESILNPQPKLYTKSFEQILTRREIEVLELIAAGSTNQQVANKLVTSINTIKSHVRSILEKLEVCSREEAVFLLATRGNPSYVPKLTVMPGNGSSQQL